MTKPATQSPRDFHFGLPVFRALFRIFPYLYSELKYSLFFTALTIAFAVGNEVVGYYSGTIIGQFYGALLDRNESLFWTIFYRASLIYIGQCGILALGSFSANCLYAAFRSNLVTSLHNIYFKKNFYYKITNIDSQGVDNPDQRITQDVDKLCTLLAVKIATSLLVAPVVITYYTVKTWQTAGGFGVGIIYIYFFGGLIVNRLLISPITKWSARVEREEGHFRYKHVSVRDNAEESAFYRAAKFEERMSHRAFYQLFLKIKGFIIWTFPNQFFKFIFDYYGGVLSYAIQVFPIFIFHSYDDLTPAELSVKISNNAFYFIYLINSFTRLTDLAMNTGELGGYVQRVDELVQCALFGTRKRGGSTDSDDVPTILTHKPLGPTDQKENGPLLRLEHLSYSPGNMQENLLTDCSMTLPPGANLLVTGPSGAGKTSLFRVLAGLWPHQGSINLGVGHGDMMFLSQKPYFPVGRLTLRQQILFPILPEGDNIDTYCDHVQNTVEIETLLAQLKLTHLLSTTGGLDERPDFEWATFLSPGEQQRLSIVRLLFHHPKVAFIDEGTSNIGVDAEEDVYRLLQKSAITFISIGHRDSLRPFHQLELRVEGGGRWSVHPIEDSTCDL